MSSCRHENSTLTMIPLGSVHLGSSQVRLLDELIRDWVASRDQAKDSGELTAFEIALACSALFCSTLQNHERFASRPKMMIKAEYIQVVLQEVPRALCKVTCSHAVAQMHTCFQQALACQSSLLKPQCKPHITPIITLVLATVLPD